MDIDAKTVGRLVKDAITENLGMKLLAFVIALLLFVLVRFQEEVERIIDVEVVPLMLDRASGLVVTSEIPKTVRLRLRGPKSQINALKEEGVQPIEIELRERQEGTEYFQLDPELFDIPAGLEFVRATPDAFPLRVERLLTRKMPIRVRLTGKLRKGAEFVEEPRPEPREVTVEGAASIVRDLAVLDTEDIDIEGLGSGTYRRVAPVRRSERFSVVGENEIAVSMLVRWTPGERTISGLPVQVGGTSLETTTQPGQVTVSLSGPQVFLDKLEIAEIKPLAQIEPEMAGRFGTHVAKIVVVGLPEAIRATSIVPSKVSVRLSAKASPRGSRHKE